MKTETKQYAIQFGKRSITYSLHRTDRRNMRVVVEPDLSVVVYVPFRVAENEIEIAVEKKACWIARTLDKVETFHPLPSPKAYVSGETLLYLGRQYRLKVVEGPTEPAKMRGRYLLIIVADKQDRIKVKASVDQWYRKRSEDIFNRILDKCQEVTSRHGIPKADITLRRMRSRWGSCSSKGRITINTSLVQAPMHCVEYVIIHELCHLKHHNHSKAFYKLLTQCMPDWKKRKEVLCKVVIPIDHSDKRLLGS